MRQSRRAFLGAAGAAGLTGLAGCTSTFENLTPENGSSDGSSEGPGGSEGSGDGPSDGVSPPEHVRTIGTQLEDFEDPEHWYLMADQGSASTTTSDVYSGGASMHLHASADTSYVGVAKSFSEPKDLSTKSLSLAVRLNEPQVTKVVVDLLAPDRGNTVSMARTLPGPVDTWVRSDMGVTSITREPDLSQVEEIRVYARRRGQTDTPIDVTIDDIRLVEQPDTGYVTFTFDDTMQTHYDVAFPAMQERGFAGVEGVISDAVYNSGRLDVGQMREMSDAGWDMASHPYVGDKLLTEYSAEKQREIVTSNREFLEQKGFREGARHFLTPKNMLGPDIVDVVQENHETLVTFGGMPNGRPPTTTYNNSRLNLSNSASIREFVDFAARYNQHLVLNTHGIGPAADELSEHDFTTMLDYVQQADVEVATFSDLLDTQG